MNSAKVSGESTIGQLVVERPDRARVFEELGIDYCCGGKQTLSDACRATGLKLPAVIALLDAAKQKSSDEESRDVQTMGLTELADHIERTHHVYLKKELPRIQGMLDRIAVAHGGKDARLLQLPRVYSSFQTELLSHTENEEKFLFPLIRKIDSESGDGPGAGGEVANPIRAMEIEHQHAGDALQAMRKLTDDFAHRSDMCNTHRAAMDSLKELEKDLHRHVHKENHILFPRAIEAANHSANSGAAV